MSAPVTRDEWGADSDVVFTPIPQPVPDSVDHHTASAVAGGANASIETEKAYMRGVEAYHQSLGWLTSAYHTVRFPSGRRYISRPSWAKGGATLGHNDTSLACCAVGNYQITEPTQAVLDSGRETYREWEDEGTLAPGVHPRWAHRDVSEAGTLCNGDRMYAEMDYLRSREDDDDMALVKNEYEALAFTNGRKDARDKKDPLDKYEGGDGGNYLGAYLNGFAAEEAAMGAEATIAAIKTLVEGLSLGPVGDHEHVPGDVIR